MSKAESPDFKPSSRKVSTRIAGTLLSILSIAGGFSLLNSADGNYDEFLRQNPQYSWASDVLGGEHGDVSDSIALVAAKYATETVANMVTNNELLINLSGLGLIGIGCVGIANSIYKPRVRDMTTFEGAVVHNM